MKEFTLVVDDREPITSKSQNYIYSLAENILFNDEVRDVRVQHPDGFVCNFQGILHRPAERIQWENNKAFGILAEESIRKYGKPSKRRLA